jgi:hypothetical protein
VQLGCQPLGGDGLHHLITVIAPNCALRHTVLADKFAQIAGSAFGPSSMLASSVDSRWKNRDQTSSLAAGLTESPILVAWHRADRRARMMATGDEVRIEQLGPDSWRVVVIFRGRAMAVRVPLREQAIKWANMEGRSYGIPVNASIVRGAATRFEPDGQHRM